MKLPYLLILAIALLLVNPLVTAHAAKLLPQGGE